MLQSPYSYSWSTETEPLPSWPSSHASGMDWLIKQAVSEIHEEGTKFGLEVLTGKALSFWHEFIDKTGEKVFVYTFKLSLSLAYFI